MKTLAVPFPRLALNDGAQHVLDRSGHQGRAEHEHILRVVLAEQAARGLQDAPAEPERQAGVCEQHGAQPIISKSGHAFIKDRMRNENAIFAGEMSAHYYFRDNFYADNGVIPFLLIVEHLSRTGKRLSEVMAPYMEGHYMSGELNYRVQDAQKTISAVKDRFHKEGTEDFTDGYSLETRDWRFNIRPSNTEPLLRLNIEAHRSGLVEKIKSEVEAIIGSKPH